MYTRSKIMRLTAHYCCLALFVGLATVVAARSQAAEPAPVFEIRTGAGSEMLSDLRGRVVYLDFWASWCKPCLQSFPWMNAMQTQYGAQGLKIIAVNVDKERRLAEKFLRKVPNNFTIVYDPEGKLASLYELIGMPSTFLIDREGNIRHRHVGFLLGKREAYESQIRQLLNEPSVAYSSSERE